MNLIGHPAVSHKLIGVQNTITIQPHFSDWCILISIWDKFLLGQLSLPVSDRSVKQAKVFKVSPTMFPLFVAILKLNSVELKNFKAAYHIKSFLLCQSLFCNSLIININNIDTCI